MIGRLFLSLILSTAITVIALWRGSLSLSGAIGAVLVGSLTLGLGGWQWAILLVIFFASSSALSHLKEEEKQTAAEKFDKGHKRDLGQVLANGGGGALVSIMSSVTASESWFPLFIGMMAAVTADTWATELGTLSRRAPRMITNGRIVETGTSGGVSLLGTTVSLAGGLIIGLAAGLAGGKHVLSLTLIGACAGLLGSLFDSLLGATVQRIYYCDLCEKDTERKLHKCGQMTRPLRGWAWLNNDLVNLWASLVGGLVALGLWGLIQANA